MTANFKPAVNTMQSVPPDDGIRGAIAEEVERLTIAIAMDDK